MFSFKEGSDDLDDWSMKDLKDVVSKFKESLNREKQTNLAKKRPLFVDDDS